jgi:hypothetical protein
MGLKGLTFMVVYALLLFLIEWEDMLRMARIFRRALLPRSGA